MPPGEAPPQPSPSPSSSAHPARSTRTGSRLHRVLGRTAAVLALVAGAALFSPAPAARAAVPLQTIGDFGANPGALNMYVYRPAGMPAGPAVVVALHGCTQSAQVCADDSGLTKFADRYGFLLVLPETTSANNSSRRHLPLTPAAPDPSCP
ncbi:PHB depolymerase family esterase [Streptomyces sp. NPDC002467]|uniref:PHB depolymerase family esterase n=1 Tax=Streptomyces sp. NPDC002467 TaxID=3364647 RepID=UPI0036CE1306